MLSVDPQTMKISMTRGDTGIFNINLKDGEGEPYTPSQEDSLEFAMAKGYGQEPVLRKNIPIDTLILKLEPADTKDLSPETYVYEVQFTSADGDVSTIILSRFALTKDVI